MGRLCGPVLLPRTPWMMYGALVVPGGTVASENDLSLPSPWPANGQPLPAAGLTLRLSRLPVGGGKLTLTENYQRTRFNSPNDAVVKSDGSIYVTDPPYGLPKKFEDPQRELDFCGVYRVSRSGVVTLLTKDLVRPNGIAFPSAENASCRKHYAS